MKAVILAGGYGTRISEETTDKPKPMIEVGGFPLLWHIMKNFSVFGVNEFVIAAGYRSDVIKNYFIRYRYLNNDLKIDLRDNKIITSENNHDQWVIHVIDTGDDVQTGARLAKLRSLLKGETFFMTYGDGLCDVDLGELVAFHKSKQVTATVTAVRPPARFGSLEIKDDRVVVFAEKNQLREGWINGGFFVLESEIFNDLTEENTCVFEGYPLEQLASRGQLAAFKHEGFWQCMDTLRDLRFLRGLWDEGEPSWKLW